MHGKPSSVNLVIDYAVDENAGPLGSDAPPPRSATPVGATLAPSRSSSAVAPPASAHSSGPGPGASDAPFVIAPASVPERVPSANHGGALTPPPESLPAGKEGQINSIKTHRAHRTPLSPLPTMPGSEPWLCKHSPDNTFSWSYSATDTHIDTHIDTCTHKHT